MALVEFSTHGRRACVEPFEYAHIEVGLEMGFARRHGHRDDGGLRRPQARVAPRLRRRRGAHARAARAFGDGAAPVLLTPLILYASRAARRAAPSTGRARGARSTSAPRRRPRGRRAPPARGRRPSSRRRRSRATRGRRAGAAATASRSTRARSWYCSDLRARPRLQKSEPPSRRHAALSNIGVRA